MFFGDQLGPVIAADDADLVERRAQHRIIRAVNARWVRVASLVFQMAGQVEVGQHGGAHGVAGKRKVVGVEYNDRTSAESVPFPVIGQQVELAGQRLR